MEITLIKPDKNLGKEFLKTILEFRSVGENSLAASFSYGGENFNNYLKYVNDAEQGINLPKGFVPFTTFWLVSNNNHILGICHLRHHLNLALSQEGGHIGYAVRPSERKKGYGTLQLHLLLEKCRKMQYDQVLITCDFDNIASQKIIEKNGGVRAGEAISPRSLKTVFHYLVKL